MLSISVLPAELVLQILLDASWCPGLEGPNPDVLRPNSLVCKSWYRLVLPHLARAVYAFTPPRLVDPLDGIDRYRSIRSVAFSSAIPDLAVTDVDADSLGHESRARLFKRFKDGKTSSPKRFKTSFEQDVAIKALWLSFFSKCAPSLRHLDIMSLERWWYYQDEPGFMSWQRERKERSSGAFRRRQGGVVNDHFGRSRGEYALDHLQLASLPVFGALTSLHIGICEGLDLGPFLKRAHLFPSLDTLVVRHTADAPNKPRVVVREPGNTSMNPRNIQIVGVPSKPDFWYRGLIEGGPVMKVTQVCTNLDAMFPQGLEFPQLDSLVIRIPVYVKNRELLQDRFPYLQKLQLVGSTNESSPCPALPSRLEYLDIGCDELTFPELRAMTSSLSRLRSFALRTTTYGSVSCLQDWAQELEGRGCSTHEAFELARAYEDHAGGLASTSADDTYEPSDDDANSDSSDDDLAPDMSNSKPWSWIGGPREELMERFLDVLQPDERCLWGIEE
ncbi:hypothetical protein JCM10296v2_000107 [Rhodotorula toruloides]